MEGVCLRALRGFAPRATRHFCFGKSAQNHFRPCAALQRMFKKFVQQGRRKRKARGVLNSTLRALSNENAAGGLFQHSLPGAFAAVPNHHGCGTRSAQTVLAEQSDSAL